MTTDRTGPVLDLERLDAAADEALAGVRIDLGAVMARAAGRRRRPVRWLLAAVAAVLLVSAAAAAGGDGLRQDPGPAEPSQGPGALPARLHPLPTLVLPVDEAPISRVAAVLQGSLEWPSGFGARAGTGVVLVGADGGEYRRLPTRAELAAVSVSADGRLVSWAEGTDGVVVTTGRAVRATRVRWVRVGTGGTGEARMDYPADREAAVENTWLSPDGSSLLVEMSVLQDAKNRSARRLDMWLVDTRSSTTRRLCSCSGAVAWDARGGLLTEGFTATGVAGTLPPISGAGAAQSANLMSHAVVVSPDGDRALGVVRADNRAQGSAAPYYLVEVDRTGRRLSTTPLGLLRDADLLAWSGRTAYVDVVSDADGAVPEVRRLTLGRSQAEVLMRPLDDGPDAPVVVAVTADVAAGGGLSVSWPAPAGEPWWSVASLHLFAVRYFLLLVGGVVALAVVVPVVVLRRRRGAR